MLEEGHKSNAKIAGIESMILRRALLIRCYPFQGPRNYNHVTEYDPIHETD